jgi:parvulin-like peptidyl-prolyl isomerase
MSEILATVNGEAITIAEVNRELAAALGRRKLSDAARKIYEQQTLEQLINRRVVQAYLNQAGVGATTAEIDRAIQTRIAQLKTVGETLQGHLKKTGTSAADFRSQLAWQISWQRFLDRELTDKALEAHFEKHRRDFDGTRLRVSQILLKPASADGNDLQKTIAEAKKIRQDIVDGRLRFADATKKHSQAPSAESGGDQGVISRHGENAEAFARAAFALQKDEISQPVVTQFGVHLIQCTEVLPGKKSWTEVCDDLSQSLASELFRATARANRAKALVKYPGSIGPKPPATATPANTPS